MRAQTLFDEMLRVQLAPALRELGFRGSGRTFNLANAAGDHALFGFQKDRWNTSAACRFTAGLAFHHRADWDRARDADPWLPAKPTLHHVTPDSWQIRVGFLLDPPHDHWWTVRREEDVLGIADHVIAVTMDVVVPQLQSRLGGARPPALPTTGWSPDCPWPFCTNPHDLFIDHVDLDSVGGSAADGFGAASLSAAHREVLARARTVEVPRAQAWKVLHISRKRLDEYADRVGAGPVLTLAQLLAVSILGTDDLLAASRWSDAAAAVGGWVAQLPDADPTAALVVGEGACAVLPLPEVLALHDAQLGLCVVSGLMGATQRLLDDLSTARLV